MENYQQKMNGLNQQIAEVGRKTANEIANLRQQHQFKVIVMGNELAMKIQELERNADRKKDEIRVKIEQLKSEKKDEDRRRYEQTRAEIQQLITQIGEVGCLTQPQKDCLKESM